MIRLLRWLLRLLWRFETENEAVLKTPGPVLLIPNHVSWLDWLFLGVCLDGDWRFVVSSVTAEKSWLHRKIMLNRRTYPIDTLSPYSAKHVAEFLAKNGRLVLFAEGRLSRTGNLMQLFEGTGFLLHKTHARLITAYIRGAHRLPCSPNRDHKVWFPKVSVHFSPVLKAPDYEHVSTSIARARLTTWLHDQLLRQRAETELRFGQQTIPALVAESAAIHASRPAFQDVSQSVTYRRLMLGGHLLGEAFAGRLKPGSQPVGVLLPNVIATPVTMLALWNLGRTPAMLNYSTGPSIMLASCQLAGLQQIITSKAFIEKAALDVRPLVDAGLELIYLEEVRATISGLSKLASLLRSRWSVKSLSRCPHQIKDTAVVLFTSGSEGIPKGVMLSHENLLANLHQALCVLDIQDWDRLFNALPLFHSFGLTVGTFLPLVRGCFTFLYPSPLHYRVIPTLAYFNDCTILLGTNTFLAGYARKARPLDFASLRYLVAGAEKLQEVTFDTYARKFGVRILEGYGVTETSPVLSVNTPLDYRLGTAGRFLPGIEYKLEPVEGITEGGRLLVRGPNIMKGYLNADAQAKFQALGGWYDTGDIVSVDEDGFLAIRGRLKRFAKISGEMISLAALEDAFAGAFPQYGSHFQIAVVSRPDPGKGEVLVVFTNEPKLTVDDLRTAIRTRGLSNLALPREIHLVKELPLLGTGKVNHRELTSWLARETH